MKLPTIIGNIMIRNANESDIPRIAEIHICGWRYAYRGLINDTELFSNRLVAKSILNIEKKYKDGINIIIYEDESDQILKGFAFHGPARDDDRKTSYEVYALYIQPEFTRNGIGYELMQKAIEIAISKKFPEIIVWVLEKNIRGMNFYIKNGFIRDGKEKMIEEWKQKEIRMSLTIAST